MTYDARHGGRVELADMTPWAIGKPKSAGIKKTGGRNVFH